MHNVAIVGTPLRDSSSLHPQWPRYLLSLERAGAGAGAGAALAAARELLCSPRRRLLEPEGAPSLRDRDDREVEPPGACARTRHMSLV